MNAVTHDAHMQAVSHKAQTRQGHHILARQGRQKLPQRNAHQNERTHRHDEIAGKQKPTGRERVQQVLLHTEVGAPDQNQNKGGAQRQSLRRRMFQSLTTTGTRAAKAHINS